jgi:hypothetical protein
MLFFPYRGRTGGTKMKKITVSIAEAIEAKKREERSQNGIWRKIRTPKDSIFECALVEVRA